MKNDPYIVSSFLKAREFDRRDSDGTLPLITISRQEGALGEEIAYRTSEILTEAFPGQHPWVVIDKDLGERVIADHHLPARINKFFSGEQILSIEEHLEGMLGISVPGDVMIRSMTRTIVQLGRIGHVILVGRAAHLITTGFPRAVNIRLIGSFDRRTARIANEKHCSPDEAAAHIRHIDNQRRLFVSTYFRSDLEDTSKYDVIFNTDRLCIDDCARSIAQIVSSPHFGKEEALKLQELRHQVLG